MSPRAVGLPAWTNFGPSTYVLPSIGQLLSKYLNGDNRMWICPSAPTNSFILTGADPLGGTGLNDQFKPNYVYLAAKEYVPALPGLGSLSAKFHVPPGALMRYVATFPALLMNCALALNALGPVTVTSSLPKVAASTPLVASE